jgi:hypothetical protein
MRREQIDVGLASWMSSSIGQRCSTPSWIWLRLIASSAKAVMRIGGCLVSHRRRLMQVQVSILCLHTRPDEEIGSKGGQIGICVCFEASIFENRVIDMLKERLAKETYVQVAPYYFG